MKKTIKREIPNYYKKGEDVKVDGIIYEFETGNITKSEWKKLIPDIEQELYGEIYKYRCNGNTTTVYFFEHHTIQKFFYQAEIIFEYLGKGKIIEE